MYKSSNVPAAIAAYWAAVTLVPRFFPDATVNGVNTLIIAAGEGLEGKQEGNTFTISASGGGGYRLSVRLR